MKIAIQGHLIRGKEVIQILENLGGKKLYYSNANDKCLVFFIDDKGYISCLHYENPILKEYDKIYTLEEFEKEFPFKIEDKVRDCSDNEIGIIVDLLFVDNALMYNVNFVYSGQAFMPTEKLKPYKEMKEKRNITLTLDKAKEWYNKGGELREVALQAYSEEELNPLPRSWEEFCKRYSKTKKEAYVGVMSKIYSFAGTNCDRDIYADRNICPSKKSAEAHLAMIQLEQLRNCWWNGWEPEWKGYEKYVIKWEGDNLTVFTAGRIHAFLVFPTREMAEEFLNCFRDLIEKAVDLI